MADRSAGTPDPGERKRRSGKRNVNGEGSIRQRSDGRWEGRAYVVATDGREVRLAPAASLLPFGDLRRLGPLCPPDPAGRAAGRGIGGHPDPEHREEPATVAALPAEVRPVDRERRHGCSSRRRRRTGCTRSTQSRCPSVFAVARRSTFDGRTSTWASV